MLLWVSFGSLSWVGFDICDFHRGVEWFEFGFEFFFEYGDCVGVAPDGYGEYIVVGLCFEYEDFGVCGVADG